METNKRPWLNRLKHHLEASLDGANVPETPVAPTDKTDKTPSPERFVGFVGGSGETQEDEMVWRVAAFRVVLPIHGPIWPPKLRNTPQTDAPGHCSLCGDALPTEPAPGFPRCQPCARALWCVLDTHELVEVERR